MAYGKRRQKSYTSRGRSAPRRRTSTGRSRVPARRSNGRSASTLRIVIEPSSTTAVQRPLVGVTAAPIGRRKF